MTTPTTSGPADERVKSRREPIEVVVGKRLFVAKPLPWRRRNELGEAIVRSYTAVLQQSINAATSKDAEGNDQIDLHFGEGQIDYEGIIKLAFPDQKADAFDELTYGELVDDVLEAALVVNGLERQRHMLDLGKSVPGRNLSEPGGDDGPKIESSPD